MMKKDKEIKSDETNPEEKVSRFRLIIELYKQSAAFKALIKLSLYFILCFTILIVVATASPKSKKESEDKTSPTTTEKIKSYHDILTDVLSLNKTLSYTITNADKTYLINYDIKDNQISGLLESEGESLKRFTIRDNIIYEVVLNEEKENVELFKELNVDFINIYKLVDLLLNSKSVKMLQSDMVYHKYDIDTTNISVIEIDEMITNIEILSNNQKYVIEVK